MENNGEKPKEEEKVHRGRFQKGWKGGPGRPAHLGEWTKHVRPLSRADWSLMFNRFMQMTKGDLQAFLADQEKRTMQELMIGNMVLATINEASEKKLDFMLDRTIGKVKETLQIEAPKPYIIRRRDGSIEELGARQLEQTTVDVPFTRSKEIKEKSK
jgi:hypothetical protein